MFTSLVCSLLLLSVYHVSKLNFSWTSCHFGLDLVARSLWICSSWMSEFLRPRNSLGRFNRNTEYSYCQTSECEWVSERRGWRTNNPNSNKVISCWAGEKEIFKIFISPDNFISIDIFGTRLHAQQASQTWLWTSCLASSWCEWERESFRNFLRVFRLQTFETTQISRMNGTEEFVHNISMKEIASGNICEVNGRQVSSDEASWVLSTVALEQTNIEWYASAVTFPDGALNHKCSASAAPEREQDTRQ